MRQHSSSALALFGAGCFWGVEESFRMLPGVHATSVGYAGGTTEQPTYEQVCSGFTQHAEVVRIEFDPKQISYAELVKKFFTLHNPTLRNRPGPDIGTQYRSVIFFSDSTQEKESRAEIEAQRQSGMWSAPIVTEVLPAPTFWPAEEYHQQYLKKQGRRSCHL